MEYKKSISQDFKSCLNLILYELSEDLKRFKKDYIFLMIFGLGIFYRLINLSQPIKEDEAMTFLSFVEPLNPLRLFVYTEPNNHVLHTIFVKISTLFFGESVVSIRLPAFLFSIGIIYLSYAICKRFGQSGIFGAITISSWPYLIAYSNNARGYSLFCFISLALVYLYLIFRVDIDKTKILFISIVSALGMFTMPTFVFIIAGIYSWISIDQFILKEIGKKRLLKINFSLFIFTSFFIVILYLPVFFFSPKGYQAVLNNSYLKSLTINTYLNSIGEHFIDIINQFSQALPVQFLYLIFSLFVIGLFKYFKDSKVFVFLLFPLILFSSITILSIKLVIPTVRTWIFLIPFFLIVTDNGFSSLIANFKRPKNLFLIFSIILFSLIMVKPLVSKSCIDIEAKCFLESEMAIKYLESQRISLNKKEIGAYVLSGEVMPLNYYNLINDGKVFLNNDKIYSKKIFLKSINDDFQRFLNSSWQNKREREIDDFDYIVYIDRYLEDNEIKEEYENLLKNYSLVMKADKLEIYSIK